MSPESSISDTSKRRKVSETSNSKRKIYKASETTGREKWHQKKNDVEDAQLSFFKMVEKTLSEPSNVPSEDSNDVFGTFIACEIKQLNLRERRIAKHEMEGILFRIQMQSESQRQHNIQPTLLQSRLHGIPFTSHYATGQFNNLNYVDVPSQNQQYPSSLQNQHFPAPTESFRRYDPPSCQQYAVSSQTFPRNGVSCQEQFPPSGLAYSPSNPNETSLQESSSNIPEDNNYSDEREY